MGRPKWPLALILLLMIIPALHSSAKTIHVPGDCPTIQSGISAAAAFDVVVVGPGSYLERIDFLGKAIKVISEQGAVETVIDAGQEGCAATFSSGETRRSVLDGFTLRNGIGHADEVFDRLGGGIFIEDASPQLLNNRIIDNTAQRGGGIACIGSKSNPFIFQCTISNNQAIELSIGGVDGGGIYLVKSYAVIERCMISLNSSVMEGGGISMISGGKPWIRYNVISANSAFYGGGGIYSSYAPRPIIESNLIEGNSARDGGGLDCMVATIRNNIIIYNEAFCDDGSQAVGYGGGIETDILPGYPIEGNYIAFNKAWSQGGGICCLAAGGTISNNIIAHNQAKDGTAQEVIGGGGICFYGGNQMPTNLWNCIFYDNVGEERGGAIYIQDMFCAVSLTHCTAALDSASEGNEVFLDYDVDISVTNSILCCKTGDAVQYISIPPLIEYSDVTGWVGGSGNIDQDPLFADPEAGDFHILYTSPCRDSGKLDTPGLPETDFEGDPRISGELVDMGADEFHTHLYCMGDFAPGGSIQAKLVGLPQTSPVFIFIGGGILEQPLPTAWGDFLLENPLSLLELNPIPANGILVLPVTVPGAPPAPYNIPLQALIGLNPDSLSNLDLLKIR